MKVRYIGEPVKIFWATKEGQFFKIIAAGETIDMPSEVYQDYVSNPKFIPLSNKKVVDLDNKQQGESHDA